MRVATLFLFAIMVLIFTPQFALAKGKTGRLQAADERDYQKCMEIRKNDLILGDMDAPVTIVEYSSLGCPHCQYFRDGAFHKLKKKYIDTGKVLYIFREFPLAASALHGFMLARCVDKDTPIKGINGTRERYWNVLDTLYETQDDWAFRYDYERCLREIATLIGVGREEFKACIANKEVESMILGNLSAAIEELDLNATPVFLINGERYNGAKSLAFFDEKIAALTSK